MSYQLARVGDQIELTLEGETQLLLSTEKAAELVSEVGSLLSEAIEFAEQIKLSSVMKDFREYQTREANTWELPREHDIVVKLPVKRKVADISAVKLNICKAFAYIPPTRIAVVIGSDNAVSVKTRDNIDNEVAARVVSVLRKRDWDDKRNKSNSE